MVADRNEIGVWVPRYVSKDHVLYDELVLGHVERFSDDGPCYACIGEKRLGPFETDTKAREAVMDHAFAAAIKRWEVTLSAQLAEVKLEKERVQELASEAVKYYDKFAVIPHLLMERLKAVLSPIHEE